MSEKLTIRVNIADRFYNMKIDVDDEEKVRLAAKKINEAISLYKQRYSGNERDFQDYLAMVSLQHMTKLLDMEQKTDISRIILSIDQLDTELDDYLVQKRQNVL